MRIVTWNCNMGLGRKRDLILALAPDILILQEVSRQDIDLFPADFKHWVGTNPHKGLAVVAFGRQDYRVSDQYTDELPWFIPLRIANLDLQLIAVWAHVKTTSLRYVRVTLAAIDHYETFISSAPTILAGDFNSNTIWDKIHGARCHGQLIARLDALGIRSLYHELSREKQGEELVDTLYMYRNRDKGYHVDYAFVPDALVAGASLVIGHPDTWLPTSDHMPLIVDLCDSHFP